MRLSLRTQGGSLQAAGLRGGGEPSEPGIESVNIDQFIEQSHGDEGYDSGGKGISALQLAPKFLKGLKKGAGMVLEGIVERTVSGPFAPEQSTPIGHGGIVSMGNMDSMGHQQQDDMLAHPVMDNSQLGMQPMVIGPLGTMEGAPAVPSGNVMQYMHPSAQVMQMQSPQVAMQGNEMLAGIPVSNVFGNTKVAAKGAIPNQVIEDHIIPFRKHHILGKGSSTGMERIVGILLVVMTVVFIIAGCIVRIRSRKKLKKNTR